MRFVHSLRFRLSILYLLTIVIPTIIITFTMPSYYQGLIANETKTLTESTLTALTREIDTYFEDLDRLTVMPYFNQQFIDSLNLLYGKEYNTIDMNTELKARRDIEYTLTYYLHNTRKEILGTILVINDGTTYITTKKTGFTNSASDDYDSTSQHWYRKALDADGKVAFISSHYQDYLPSHTAQQVFSVARLIKDPETQRHLAVMMADADTIILEKLFSEVDFKVTSIVSLIDDNGSLIYSNRHIPREMITRILEGHEIVNGPDDSYTVVYKTVERTQWNTVVLLSNSEIKSKLRWIYTVGMLFTVGELLLAFSLFFVLSRYITDPFKKMIRVMKEVENGNMEASFNVKGRDEISQLGSAFNNMIYRLNDLIDREYRAVLSKRNAEYHALQSQIQPHFLYNTLNGFIGLNRLGARESLEKAVLSLKGMLRYTLEQGEWTTVAEEFLFLQRYCELQKIRFQERLEVTIEYEEPAAKRKIPKLLIQPLVENSIIHGIEPLDRQGMVSITAKMESTDDGNVLRIVVDDNGTGFDVEALDESKSVGLSNVHERLVRAYNNAKLSVSSRKGFGTCIIIDIPGEDVKI